MAPGTASGPTGRSMPGNGVGAGRRDGCASHGAVNVGERSRGWKECHLFSAAFPVFPSLATWTLESRLDTCCGTTVAFGLSVYTDIIHLINTVRAKL